MNKNKFLKYPILLIALLLLSAGNEENTNPSSLKITGNGNNQYLLSIEDDQTSNSSKILTVNQNGIHFLGPFNYFFSFPSFLISFFPCSMSLFSIS